MTDKITEPMYSDAPFTRSLPYLPSYVFQRECYPICPCCFTFPKVRGIPPDAQPVQDSEREAILKQLAGDWKIKMLQPGDPGYAKFMYVDVLVRDGVATYSGGFSSRRDRPHNEPETIPLHFFRGTDGKLYMDYTGSYIVDIGTCAQDEVAIQNGVGFKLVWQRQSKWMMGGLGLPPQMAQLLMSSMVGAPAQQVMPPAVNAPTGSAFCTGCGAKLNPGAKFCSGCGASAS